MYYRRTTGGGSHFVTTDKCYHGCAVALSEGIDEMRSVEVARSLAGYDEVMQLLDSLSLVVYFQFFARLEAKKS